LLAVAMNLAVASGVVCAQQPSNVPVVGALMLNEGPHEPVVEEMRKGLRALGYVEGRNITIEYRLAQGQVDRLPRLAEELVGLKVDVIFVGTESSARAAKQATNVIPIVLVAHDYDPVAAGLIASLNRPGGNVTGVFSRQSHLVAKRLELLKEALPGVSRVAVFWDSFGQRQLDELTPAARSLGVRLELVELRAPYDFKEAFKAAKRKRAGALMCLVSPMFNAEHARIAALAIENGLPAIFQEQYVVEAGGFLSYGPDPADAFGRSAYFIDRLLKGAKPSDLPVEQVSTIKLVVNLKTAKALGISVPESILLRADKVVQ
jgi:putative ABC transport system substrate-binding protein